MVLSTKKSKAVPEADQHFAPGDVVLAKVKGYPPWPAIVCDESNVPSHVRKQKTIKGAYTVRFFPAADYGWSKGRELIRLTKREIEAFIADPHKKGPELKDAYRLALDPEEWNEEQDRIVAAGERAAEDEREAVDELEEEDDVAAAGGKRKRASEKKSGVVRESAESKAAKKRKMEVEKSESKAPHSAKGSVTSRKSAGAEEAEGDDAEQLDPETKKVKGWRHALQRAFLTKDGAPINEAGIEAHDETFKAVEAYTQITPDQLRKTKIGKVMKRIVGLTDIPREAEFHFRDRASKLCEKWGEVMASTKPNESAAKDQAHQDTPAAPARSASSPAGEAPKKAEPAAPTEAAPSEPATAVNSAAPAAPGDAAAASS